MESFISQYPGVVIAIGGSIASIGIVMLSVIGWMIKNSYNRVTASLTDNTEALKQNTESVSVLKSRLTIQERICELYRVTGTCSGSFNNKLDAEKVNE